MDGYNNNVSVHQKNLYLLMIELFKTKHGLNPSIMNEIFCQQTNQYSLRNDRDFNLPPSGTKSAGKFKKLLRDF